MVAAVAHIDLEPRAQRVHHRDADAVQTTGHLVAAAAELAAGVEHGQRHRHRRHLLARGGVDGDAAAVVGDADTAVVEQGDLDPVAVAGQRLVDRVVHDLPHQVVQAALTGRADVHARTLADRLETLEDLDRGRVVLALLDRVARSRGCERCGGLGHRVGGRRLRAVFRSHEVRPRSSELSTRETTEAAADDIAKVDPGRGNDPKASLPRDTPISTSPSTGNLHGSRRKADFRPHRASMSAAQGRRKVPIRGSGPQIGPGGACRPGSSGVPGQP